MRIVPVVHLITLAGCHWVGGLEERALEGEDGLGAPTSSVGATTTGSGPSGGSGGASGSGGAMTGPLSSSGPAGGGGGGSTSGSGGEDPVGGGGGGTGGAGTGGGGGSGGAPACEIVAEPAELWVDVSAPDGGNGTICHPFRTVTDGLAALSDSRAETRTLHVAAGTYEAPLETFPLSVVGPMVIVGSGSEEGIGTTLRGSDLATLPGVPGSPPALATVESRGGVVELRDLALRPEVEGMAHFGVYCVDGNAPLSGDPPGPDVSASFRVRGIHARGFGVSLGAYGGSAPGCYLDVRGSTFEQNNDAVWAWGAAGHSALRVGGSGLADGNLFVDNEAGGDFDSGVNVWGPTSLVHIEGNVFEANQVAVYLPFWWDPSGSQPHPEVVIVDNDFLDNTHSGVFISNQGVVSELSRNRFDGNAKGVALLSAGGTEKVSNIERARENVFQRNGMGVLIQGPPIGSNARSDFGTASDPGKNVLSCNDLDLVLDVAAEDPILFAGNSWDHVPPTHAVGSSVPWGTDVIELPASTADFDVSAPGQAHDPCP